MHLTTVTGTSPGGRPPATPTARNAGPQGRTPWDRCWVPMPTPTAPGTHGSRDPSCPPQRTAGRWRDSAWQQTPLPTVAGQPPRGRPPTAPAARSPHRACKPRGQCWAPTRAHPRPQHVGSGPQQPAERAGNRGRGRAGTRTPLTMKEGDPPGDALPPPPQRATPACKGASCGVGAGSPHPRQPRPGHTDRGTLATRPRGWAAKGGTAPDVRCPWPRGQATPPGMAPHRPRGTQPPQDTHAKGTVLGPHNRGPRPQDMDGGHRQPARRAGSRGRGSA